MWWRKGRKGFVVLSMGNALDPRHCGPWNRHPKATLRLTPHYGPRNPMSCQVGNRAKHPNPRPPVVRMKFDKLSTSDPPCRAFSHYPRRVTRPSNERSKQNFYGDDAFTVVGKIEPRVWVRGISDIGFQNITALVFRE